MMKKYTNEFLAGYLDHAVLDPAMNDKQLRENIMIGVNAKCYTVCVNPDAIALAKECIQGTSTKLCVVMDFPFGSSHTSSKVAQCKAIIDEGDVFEIDMVANYGKIKSKDLDYVTNEIRLITELCHKYHVGLKVIVETDALSKEEVKDALECCVAAGADFIKTSTGYFRGPNVLGATPEICDFLVKEAAGRIKVKGSGGIRSKQRLIELIELGIERAGVGCASTLKILNDEVSQSNY